MRKQKPSGSARRLKANRAKSLLKTAADELTAFSGDLAKSNTIAEMMHKPSREFDRDVVAKACRYLHEIGLSIDAAHLLSLSKKIQFEWMDIGLAWIAKDMDEEGRQEMKQIYGPFKPIGRDAKADDTRYLIFCGTVSNAARLAHELHEQLGGARSQPKRLSSSTARAESALTDKERAALNLLRQSKKPIKGAALAAKIGVKDATLRKHYLPKLRDWGLKNDGDGYFIAEGR